jgi:hypothetical protein
MDLDNHDRDTLQRLVKVETYINLKFAEQDNALKLARENDDLHRREEKAANEIRLGNMNGFRERIDRLEGTLATRDFVNAKNELFNTRLAGLTRLVYIGLGIVLALQAVLVVAVKIAWNQ